MKALVSHAPSNWEKISCTMLRYYKGAPEAYSGTFESGKLVIWKLLKGSVTVSYSGLQLEGRENSWVILTGGRRSHEFSPDAVIESIQLYLELSSAHWLGPRGVILEKGVSLDQACADLRKGLHKAGQRGRSIHPPESLIYHALLQGAVWSFLAKLLPELQRAGIEPGHQKITDPRIARSLSIIESLPTALPWDRDLMARAVNLSAHQLDRIWQKERTQTPFQYWEARRIGFAREKLETSHWSIKEIASELGFSQLAQFSNWFHRQQGCSPRSYRETFLQ